MSEKKPATPEQKPPRFVHNYTPISQRVVLREQHNADETKTERAGFVPMEKRIQSIINAGQKLDASRRAQYHYGEGEPIHDNFADFAPDTNLDITDIPGVVNRGNTAMADNAEGRKAAKKEADVKRRAKLKEELKALENPEPPAPAPAPAPAPEPPAVGGKSK